MSIRDAATRGERYVSIGRAFVFAIILIRQVWVFEAEDRAWEGGLQLLIAGWLVSSLAFSVVVAWRFRDRLAPDWIFALSVLVDFACCFIALLSNSLWPGPRYEGNLMLPDIAFLILTIVAASVRLYPFLIVEATVLASAAFGTLVVFDLERYPLLPLEFLGRTSAVGVMLIGAAIASYLTAASIRRLALDAAERSLIAEGMQRRLGVLMRDHHDARTLLSSAALNAELMHQELGRSEADVGPDLREIASDLRKDLHSVNEYVASIRERAYSGIRLDGGPESVDVPAAITEVVSTLQHLFPETRITTEFDCRSSRASLTGGPTNLIHVIQNLVTNACEGDGKVRARGVDIKARAAHDGRTIVVEIRDDGPGFAEEILASSISERPTTKRDGSGLGLWLVETWLLELGTALHRSNARSGGAVVRFELPARARERTARRENP